MAGPSRPGAKGATRRGIGQGLDAEGLALWRKVTASVRPIDPLRTDMREPLQPEQRTALVDRIKPVAAGVAKPHPVPPRLQTPVSVNGLDAGWDKRLSRGMASPDRIIDLHGHTLASAHIALEAAIGSALAADERLLLVVTGKPPRAGTPGRGLIRAAIPDWLAASGWSSRIAAVRNAHPRHGGAGALYLILRRRR